MAKNSYIPEGYSAITPSLMFKGTEAAITWYQNVFGAKEKMRMDGPDKKIMHAELKIGDSLIFLGEDNPQSKTKLPSEANGNTISLYIYLPNVNETIKKATQNGAKLVMASQDMFYGDRVGCIEDPFGYTWVIATHIKDVPENEAHRLAEQMQ